MKLKLFAYLNTRVIATGTLKVGCVFVKGDSLEMGKKYLQEAIKKLTYLNTIWSTKCIKHMADAWPHRSPYLPKKL